MYYARTHIHTHKYTRTHTHVHIHAHRIYVVAIYMLCTVILKQKITKKIKLINYNNFLHWTLYANATKMGVSKYFTHLITASAESVQINPFYGSVVDMLHFINSKSS